MPMIATWPSVEEVKKCEDVETCLRWHRFLPPPFDEVKIEVIDAVVERFSELRKADPAGYTEASKRLGWG